MPTLSRIINIKLETINTKLQFLVGPVFYRKTSFQSQVKSGFTLIELMVVVTIISILTSVAYVNFNVSQNKGRDGKRKQDLKAIAAALVSFRQDNDFYPPPCVPSPCTSTAQYTSDGADPWIPDLTSNYIQKLPKDPHQAGILQRFAQVFTDVGPTPQVASSHTTVIDRRVSQGSDDAEENLSDSSVNISSSDLELAVDGSSVQEVGMRFTNVTVPQGAAIVSAYVEFEVDETGSTATSLTIKGQNADNAATFSTSAGNVSTRSKTTASVSWPNVPSWTTLDAKHQTPDLASIIQEIVNRSGWNSGNSLAIYITGSGTRTAEAYDGEAPAAPLLHVEYSAAAPSPPTVDIKANSSDGPITVTSGDTVVLSWTVTNSPTSCSASSAWSGAKSTSGGTENVVVTASGTYTLTCTNAGGDGSDSVTVNVSVPSPPPSLPPSPPASPAPSPSPPPVSGDCLGKNEVYCYVVSADRNTFLLWAKLDNENDSQTVSHAEALCSYTPPSTNFNYCVESPK